MYNFAAIKRKSNQESELVYFLDFLCFKLNRKVHSSPWRMLFLSVSPTFKIKTVQKEPCWGVKISSYTKCAQKYAMSAIRVHSFRATFHNYFFGSWKVCNTFLLCLTRRSIDFDKLLINFVIIFCIYLLICICIIVIHKMLV